MNHAGSDSHTLSRCHVDNLHLKTQRQQDSFHQLPLAGLQFVARSLDFAEEHFVAAPQREVRPAFAERVGIFGEQRRNLVKSMVAQCTVKTISLSSVSCGKNESVELPGPVMTAKLATSRSSSVLSVLPTMPAASKGLARLGGGGR